jgi:ubiquinone/menaquinone biosynthesis C-methylase UbiE
MCPVPEVPRRLEQSYDEFERVEDAFDAALDESLRPRSPELLYEIVRDFELPQGSLAVDVGCGQGRHAYRLSERLGLRVVGVDPVPRQVEVATAGLEALDADVARRIRFTLGAAEALPVEDRAADLVWCRDVMVHVADLERAYAEFHRVLRDGGRALVYQMFGTERLEPREAEWLWRALGLAAGSADPARTEAAIAAAGLRVDERLDLGSEWGEWSEERSGAVGRKLLHAARLLRDPERYRARFGDAAYEIMLGDRLWHVYAMIGKLERRAYVLTKP